MPWCWALTAAKDYRNAPNTYGWNVEIDPFAPRSTPKKRTAMGRFAHEGAWPARVEAGKPLVWYMGCDSRNEYIYKYVSNASWDPVDASRGLAAGDKYLDDGKLYVAKFNADGTGNWVELSFGANGITAANTVYSFADQADVLINTRLAADVVGATKMDRPEWGAVDPVTGAVYMTLTNNNATLRTLAATDAANPRHYNDKRSDGTDQRGNPNGHIIRWLEDAGDPAATKFKWDIFLFGARESADPANVNLSGLTADNDFSSPDGLWFSKATNVCWIQTDDGAYTDKTNCMLLAALPGEVSDGGVKTITNTDVERSREAGADLRGRQARHEAAPLPRRPGRMRDHGAGRVAGRTRAVRQHPASGRGHSGCQHRQSGAVHQSLAGWRRQPSALSDDRHHPQRRRRDRRVATRSCVYLGSGGASPPFFCAHCEPRRSGCRVRRPRHARANARLAPRRRRASCRYSAVSRSGLRSAAVEGAVNRSVRSA